MAIKLFVTDMDGTLLNSKREISEVNRKAIKQAIEDGMIFTIATGRMHKSALPYVEKLGLDDIPIITYNGGMIKTIGGKEIITECIEQDLANEVLEFAQEIGEYCQVYTKSELYYREHCAQSDWYENAAGVIGHAVGDDLCKYTYEAPKMLIINKTAELTPINIEKFQKRFEGRLVGLNSDPTYIEIMKPTVSKANAMLKLAEIFGVEQKDVLAIGDSGNDVSMLKAAGVGVAVANATPAAKAAAKYFVVSNEENGIADAINKFFYER